MIEVLFLIAKGLGFVMFVAATYRGAQYYKNRADDYETERENMILKQERRERAVQHFENLEK
ncbi:MAG: hypothetical protein ABJN69_09965 [Hellea sp.]